jgi:hypothetical protein
VRGQVASVQLTVNRLPERTAILSTPVMAAGMTLDRRLLRSDSAELV